MVAGYYMSDFGNRLDPTSPHLPTAHEYAIAGAAGIAFGFVYWLLAGRKAGAWRARI
jgi:hypothetical protein